MYSSLILSNLRSNFVEDFIELTDEQLPAPLSALLDASPAVVVTLERLPDGRVVARPLHDVPPEMIAHAQVTLAKYREALMNLT